jgi:hypothetical protein
VFRACHNMTYEEYLSAHVETSLLVRQNTFPPLDLRLLLIYIPFTVTVGFIFLSFVTFKVLTVLRM